MRRGFRMRATAGWILGLAVGFGAMNSAKAGDGTAEESGIRREKLDFLEKASTLTPLLREGGAAISRVGPGWAGRAPRDPVRIAAVLEADASGDYVALGAGSADGVRPGHVYDVFRGDRRIARVRVREVRERIAGAVVEKPGRMDVPKAGDRAVLARNE